MSINTIYDKKWQKFLRHVWLFKYIPFVDFVLAAGSLATSNPRTQRAEQSSHDGNPRTQRAEQSSYDGNMKEDSDFDVIVGVRQGRIFTVRFFCFLVFKFLGLWAQHPGKSKDRLCFNHFVTPRAYRLQPPHNVYWQNLYASLVPVYGTPEVIQRFYDANADWMQFRRMYEIDKRHVGRKSNWVKRTREWLLGGNPRTQRAEQSSYDETFGDGLEKILKNIQLRKIKNSRNAENEYRPRITISDDELEFHPHTKRIEQYAR